MRNHATVCGECGPRMDPLKVDEDRALEEAIEYFTARGRDGTAGVLQRLRERGRIVVRD